MEEMNEQKMDKRFFWDLTKYYKNDDEFNKDFESVQKYLLAFDKFKGNLNNVETILEYLQTKSKMRDDLERLFSFVGLSEDLNVNDNSILEKREILDNFHTKLNLILTPLSTELSKQSDQLLDACINDERFYNYKFGLISVKEEKQHVLSEQEEQIFALLSPVINGYEDVYTKIMNNDMRYDPVLVDGKPQKLTQANAITFYQNKDQNVRKQTSVNMVKALDRVAYSVGSSYIYKVKADCADLKLRHYKTRLDVALNEDKIPTEVYNQLIKVVGDNQGFVEKFHKIRKKALNLDKYYSCDSSVPMVDNVKLKLSIEEQIAILRKALAPLGEKYLENIDLAINNHWFDLYPNDNKINNAFATCNVNLKQPYVFMQQSYDVDSLFALAHEFGHAVNFKYCMDNQPNEYVSNAIYNAEIASTTNENLLTRYLLDNAKTIDEKIYYLQNEIENFIGTVITQTKFSEFENYAYTLVENDEPITVDILCNKWVELQKKYNGNAFDEMEELKPFKKGIAFASIPHFVFSTYYVFNYATSFTCAYNLASQIYAGNKDMQEKYLKFLCKGSSQYPNEQCEEMGIYLQTGEAYKKMFKEMNDKLEQLDKLVEQKLEQEKALKTNEKQTLTQNYEKINSKSKKKQLTPKMMRPKMIDECERSQ